MTYPYHTQVKAFEKSVVVDGQAVFPLTDPEYVAERLRYLIGKAENRAYKAGRKDAQLEMRKALGFPGYKEQP